MSKPFRTIAMKKNHGLVTQYVIFVYVSVCLQGYYPSNKPGVEPRRPCRPVNITPWLHFSNGTNRVTVTWGNFGKVRV